VCFGKIVSVRTALRVLRRQNLTLQRPRPTPALADAARQQVFFDDLRARVQGAGPKDRFLFLDWCTVQRAATIFRTWGERGHRPQVQVAGLHEHVHVLGVLDSTVNEAHFMFAERLNSATFRDFLFKLVQNYGRYKLHIVLDNAPAHRAKLTREFADCFAKNIELIFLPPYSPRLNPIEKFWAFLRRCVTHNTFFSSLDEMKVILMKFLNIYAEPNEKVRKLCNIYFREDPVPVEAM
jgi:transposase